MYDAASNEMRWYVSGNTTLRMMLRTAGLTVYGTVTPSSDKRLKFNDQPLVNALDVINRLEPVEYFQT